MVKSDTWKALTEPAEKGCETCKHEYEGTCTKTMYPEICQLWEYDMWEYNKPSSQD